MMMMIIIITIIIIIVTNIILSIGTSISILSHRRNKEE